MPRTNMDVGAEYRCINMGEEALFFDSPITTKPVDSTNPEPLQNGPITLVEQSNRISRPTIESLFTDRDHGATNHAYPTANL